jgi:RHS repeat-associated protein
VVHYHPNGALTGFTYGNGVVHTATPNTRDLPGTISDIGTSTLLSYTHTYDENGNPTVITDGVPGSPDSKTLTYDDLDRLETATAAGTFVSASMIYDGLDNLTKYQVGLRDYRYVINAATQRLDRINNAVGMQLITYQHDVRGNTTQKNQTGNNLAFLFDRANRLTEVKRNNAVVSAYRYDGNGRRIKSVKPDGDFRYQIYSQAGQYLWDANFDEDQANQQVIQTAYNYIHLGRRLIAKRKSENSSTVPESQLPLFADGFETLLREPDTTQLARITAKNSADNPFEPDATAAISVQYVHVDALGSPVAESDIAGNLIGSRSYYEPFGHPLTIPVEGSPSYTGHQFDASTGLIQAQQRFFDPSTGRSPSTDPVGVDTKSAWNFNRYAYANNSPYKFTDPDGRYGRGSGWSDDDWSKFDMAQGKAASALERTSSRMQRALDSGKGMRGVKASFEKTFGKGSGTEANMRSVAGALGMMAGALRDDGSMGFTADGMSFSAMKAAYPSAKSTYGALNPDGTKLLVVNLDHKVLNSPVALAWTAGHESAHTALGYKDYAYKLGSPSQQQDFWNLSTSNPSQALVNPDHLMNAAVGDLAKEFQ